MQRGNGAFDGLQGVGAIGFEIGNGLEQAAGVGMRWGLKNVSLAAEFDQVAGVHDGDTVGDLRNDREIVRDKQHGEAETGAEIGEQIEDLRLDGDVQSGGRFVGDEQARAVDDGHGDHDALAHAAGKLMRIIAVAARGVGDGDVVHGVDRAAPGFLFRDWIVREHGFGNLVADAHDRVEGGHRLLKNHGDLRAPEEAHGIVGESR